MKDVKGLRNLFKSHLNALVKQMEEMRDSFTEEREFFLAKAVMDRDTIQDLTEQSLTLSRKFAAEKVFTD